MTVQRDFPPIFLEVGSSLAPYSYPQLSEFDFVLEEIFTIFVLILCYRLQQRVHTSHIVLYGQLQLPALFMAV